MPARLPPLKTLQVFEAAARHMSFKAAAEELFLSPSAVSRQIQSLEARLGVRLFARQNRSIALTEPGRELAEAAIDSLCRLRHALERLSDDGQRLRLSAAPVFASEWLLPRLPAFEAAHPEMKLEMMASAPSGDDPSPLVEQEADCAMLHGVVERWANYESLRLLPPMPFLPVCAPGLLKAPLTRPEQLADYPWLVNQLTPWVWEWYLRELGVAEISPVRRIVCDAFPLYVQSMLQGRGISIAPMPAVYRLLQEGKLVVAFDQRVVHPTYNYYFIWPPQPRPKPALAAFLRWLRTQVVDDWRDVRVGA